MCRVPLSGAIALYPDQKAIAPPLLWKIALLAWWWWDAIASGAGEANRVAMIVALTARCTPDLHTNRNRKTSKRVTSDQLKTQLIGNHLYKRAMGLAFYRHFVNKG